MKFLLDVDESCALKALPLQTLRDDGETGLEAHSFGTLLEDSSPLTHGARGGHGIIVAAEESIIVETLDPTARLEDLEGLGKERVPVGHASDQEPHVDIIQGVGLKCPFLREVIDLTVIR
jgi:hypothetical protein